MASELVKELRGDHAWPCVYGEKCVRCRAAARIAELEAVVERLPKTDDEFPAVPGDRVYAYDRKSNEIREYVVEPFWEWSNPDYEDEGTGVTCWYGGIGRDLDTCYSTPEAAEAAKGGA